MFDRTYVSRGPVHVTVSHTEKRAPTDESVRLLREMEKAARDAVIESLRLPSNILEAEAHLVRDQCSLGAKIVIHYCLTGRRREVRIDHTAAAMSDAVPSLVDALAKDLAAVIAGSAVPGIGR